jgi:hypothetical protein
MLLQIGVQLGNRLLCKSQDPRRKSPKIVAAKACQYLNIQVDDTFMVGAVYIWSRIRPYLSHDDTAARLVAELTGYFNTRDQTAWAMDLLQLLKGTVKPLVSFPATDNECITSSVSGSTEPVLQRAKVSVHGTIGWSSSIMNVWVLIVSLGAWCIRLQTLAEVSTP